MKKKLLVLGAAALLATSAQAFTGSVTVGMESTTAANESWSGQTWSRSDKLVPYVKLAVTPFPGNRLRIDAAYHNTQEYNKYKATDANGKFRSGEEQFEMIFRGYQYRNGNFTFAPRAGFRINTYDINEGRAVPNASGVAAASQNERRIQYRFYPDMTYTVNRQTQLYFGGWIGPMTFETRGRGRQNVSTSANGTNWGKAQNRTYTNNWQQELEVIGARYTFANRNRVWTSLYNERQFISDSTKYNRWQYRVGGDYRVTENLLLRPYTRIDLDFNQVNLAGNANKTNKRDLRDREAIRVSMVADYRIDSDWSLVGEVYWNRDKQSGWGNTAAPKRTQWFYNLGVTRKF